MASDDFYLAWLARECRFRYTIHFAPKTLLGYTPVRRAIVTPRAEPDLQAWLAKHDINHRIISDRDELRRLVRLLSPVRDLVKDIQNMDRLTNSLNKPLRGLAHEDLFSAFSVF